MTITAAIASGITANSVVDAAGTALTSLATGDLLVLDHANDRWERIVNLPTSAMVDQATVRGFIDGPFVQGLLSGLTGAARLSLDDLKDADLTSLDDTPNSYSGQAGKILEVNAGEDSLVFADKLGISSVNSGTRNYTQFGGDWLTGWVIPTTGLFSLHCLWLETADVVPNLLPMVGFASGAQMRALGSTVPGSGAPSADTLVTTMLIRVNHAQHAANGFVTWSRNTANNQLRYRVWIVGGTGSLNSVHTGKFAWRIQRID